MNIIPDAVKNIFRSGAKPLDTILTSFRQNIDDLKARRQENNGIVAANSDHIKTLKDQISFVTSENEGLNKENERCARIETKIAELIA